LRATPKTGEDYLSLRSRELQRGKGFDTLASWLVNRRSWTPWCGGTLISDSYVLTAAHCMKNKKARSFEVILGDRDTSTRTETAEIRRTVENIIIHPKFGSRSTFDYDFALLKVWPPVNFETHSNIRPACLPEEGQENSLAYGGRTGTVSGWGLVDGKTRATQLQAVQVEVLPDKECTNRFSHQISILPRSYGWP